MDHDEVLGPNNFSNGDVIITRKVIDWFNQEAYVEEYIQVALHEQFICEEQFNTNSWDYVDFTDEDINLLTLYPPIYLLDLDACTLPVFNESELDLIYDLTDSFTHNDSSTIQYVEMSRHVNSDNSIKVVEIQIVYRDDTLCVNMYKNTNANDVNTNTWYINVSLYTITELLEYEEQDLDDYDYGRTSGMYALGVKIL